MRADISEHIRECACGEAPIGLGGQPRIANWIGNRHQWKALTYLSGFRETFFLAPDEQQRLFLLFVAEALS